MASQQKMCETCQESPATVHLTEMSQQQVVLERHLCDTCAAKQGLIGKMQMSLVAELLGNLKDKQKGAAKEPDIRCPDCGILYSDFRGKARFGCARDYDVFRKHVVALLEKIHGATEHVGKRPKGAPKAVPKTATPPKAAAAPKATAAGPATATAAVKPSKGTEEKSKEVVEVMKAKTVATLEKELEKLIKAEEYEKAAKLRDQIRDMKAKKETKE
ncbi:MAG: UvrB/UvrC motif-containing protein [Planctomycetes bacterium]|nr:UvrB/UvrC motif-containing protein [Planctomycetota bacterium]